MPVPPRDAPYFRVRQQQAGKAEQEAEIGVQQIAGLALFQRMLRLGEGVFSAGLGGDVGEDHGPAAIRCGAIAYQISLS